MQVTDRVVWVTGASAGIGEALALELARRKAKLVLSARRRERLEELKTRCLRHTSEVHVLPLDLEDIGGLADKPRQAQELAGTVDVLVCNAGMGQNSLALDTSLDVIERIHRTNFLGTVALCNPMLKEMVQRRHGQVVVTSSTLGKFGIHRRSAYAASKHALHGYFDSLRLEIEGSGVEITMVCPGWVKTEIEVRAATADGSPRGPDTRAGEDGMSAEAFAPKMVDAMVQGKREVYIGGSEIAAVWMKRFLPAKLVDRALKGAKTD